MDEIWKPIPEWGGLYEISNLGQVKSLCHITPTIRKQRLDKDGYCLVTLKSFPRNKTLKVHQAVLAAFKGTCPEGYECNHLNGDRADNHLINLEYATKSENHLHAWKNFRSPETSSLSKINQETARLIRQEYQATHRLEEIAAKYGVSRNCVWLVGTNRTWKTI